MEWEVKKMSKETVMEIFACLLKGGEARWIHAPGSLKNWMVSRLVKVGQGGNFFGRTAWSVGSGLVGERGRRVWSVLGRCQVVRIIGEIDYVVFVGVSAALGGSSSVLLCSKNISRSNVIAHNIGRCSR